eukprot:1590635-Amphidinium_carterae.1
MNSSQCLLRSFAFKVYLSNVSGTDDQRYLANRVLVLWPIATSQAHTCKWQQQSNELLWKAGHVLLALYTCHILKWCSS